MTALRETFAHLFHPRMSNNHRPRILHPEGYVVFLFLALFVTLGIHNIPALPQGAGDILGYSSTITPAKVVELTNAERANAGIASLTLNDTLSQAALAKANDMFADQYWAHFSPSGKSPWDFISGSGYRYTVAGENLARDFLHTDEMVRAWMNSPTHRDNIVNAKYQDIGIAVVDGTLNGVETTLVVQMFGSARQVPAIAQIPEPVEVTPTTVPVEIPSQVTETPAEPVLTPTSTPATLIIQGEQREAQPTPFGQAEVLAASFQTTIQSIESAPLLSPLHLSKAFFLAIIMLVVSVLVYDTMIIENMNTVRFVGKNLAHIALFMTIFFLIIFFKGGLIR